MAGSAQQHCNKAFPSLSVQSLERGNHASAAVCKRAQNHRDFPNVFTVTEPLTERGECYCAPPQS